MTLRASECYFRGGDGELVHFDVRDDGSDACGVIVFLHGLGEHFAKYDEWLEYAVERGYHVAAYDQRGHGRTPGRRGDFAFADLVADLERFVEVVVDRWGDVPVFLVAHSLGGLVALRWVAEGGHDALRGAVLSSPALDVVEEIPPWKRWAFGALIRLAPRLSLPRRSDVAKLTADPDRIAAWRSDPLRHDRITPRAMVGIVEAMREARESPLAVTLPLLLLLTPEDTVTSTEATLAWAAESGADVTILENPTARHEILNDVDRREAYERICDWLDARLA
jgi:alpha-beta hydrolase superfamily lysophospholipase